MRSKNIKIFSFSFLVLFSFQSLIGQNWFPTGTEWVHSFENGFSSYAGYEQTIVGGDTIFNGVPCKQLKRWKEEVLFDNLTGTVLPGYSGPISSFYAYENNDSIFLYTEYYGDFHLMYDFSLQVGDTMLLDWPPLDCQHKFFLDSLDLIDIQGQERKRQYFTVFSESGGEMEFSQLTVIEGIGAVDYSWSAFDEGYGYLIPTIMFAHAPTCGTQDGDKFRLRCYDSEIEYHLVEDCYELPEVTNTDEAFSEKYDIEITPNPVDEYINIEYSEGLVLNGTQFFSSSGELVKNGMRDQNWIEVKTLPAGVYILKMIFDKGTQSKKIIVK